MLGVLNSITEKHFKEYYLNLGPEGVNLTLIVCLILIKSLIFKYIKNF